MSLPDGVSVEIGTSVLEEMTFGELEELAELGGETALEDIAAGRARPKALTALAYLVLRRSYPDVTIEDVRKLKLTALRPAQEPNPTGAGA
jgi:hypothetical protein